MKITDADALQALKVLCQFIGQQIADGGVIPGAIDEDHSAANALQFSIVAQLLAIQRFPSLLAPHAWNKSRETSAN